MSTPDIESLARDVLAEAEESGMHGQMVQSALATSPAINAARTTLEQELSAVTQEQIQHYARHVALVDQTMALDGAMANTTDADMANGAAAKADKTDTQAEDEFKNSERYADTADQVRAGLDIASRLG